MQFYTQKKKQQQTKSRKEMAKQACIKTATNKYLSYMLLSRRTKITQQQIYTKGHLTRSNPIGAILL